MLENCASNNGTWPQHGTELQGRESTSKEEKMCPRGLKWCEIKEVKVARNRLFLLCKILHKGLALLMTNAMTV